MVNLFFYDCSLLESVVLTSTLVTINESAFNNCSSLKTIIIPKIVETIGHYAFHNCSVLTIYCEIEEQPEGWHYL